MEEMKKHIGDKAITWVGIQWFIGRRLRFSPLTKAKNIKQSRMMSFTHNFQLVGNFKKEIAFTADRFKFENGVKFGICRKCIDVFKEVVPDITVYQTGLDSITDSNDSEDILECTSECTQATNSQTSNWSDNIQTPLSKTNQALSTIGRGSISPLKFQLSKPLDDVKESTLRYIKRKATESIDVLLESIAPGQSSDLKKLIFSEGIKNLNEPEQDSELTKLILTLFNDIYTNNNTVKYQLLSMIAEKYTKKELQTLIPGLTVYKIDQARQYAYLHGPGSTMNEKAEKF
ncbi:Hypothetical predicted protein [Mytilus galloprovincialis]|uniref:Uncharacterized protein n=1 Tax=Mytilus galloprovincialis TaxID=29158 RepID=A0A8B6DW25_MYTGA|nr:Hypothetical predicted protein [Mytilus galloprovincialis]